MTTQHVLNEQMKYWAERSATLDRQAEISALLAAATVASAGAATGAAAVTGAAAPAGATTTTTTPTTTAAAAATDDAVTATTTDDAAAAVAAAAAAATPSPRPMPPIPSPAMREHRFKEWLLYFDSNRFYAWAGHSDNATHFKSGKMFHYWSNRSTDVDFLKMVWINFGCPGHGKGPWDGFGAVVKTQVQKTKAPVSTPMEG